MSEQTDLLTTAHLLLSTKSNWNTDTLATDKYGHTVMPQSQNATSWCAVGSLKAFNKVTQDTYRAARSLLDEVSRKLHGRSNVIFVNDSLGYDSVMKVFETAICASIQEDEQNESKKQGEKT